MSEAEITFGDNQVICSPTWALMFARSGPKPYLYAGWNLKKFKDAGLGLTTRILEVDHL